MAIRIVRMVRAAIVFGVAVLFVVLAGWHPLAASAASVTVTVSDDSTNACATTGSSPCSLRDAVTFSNHNQDTRVTFNLPDPSTITLTTNAALGMVTPIPLG
jgi:hypothetical protein